MSRHALRHLSLAALVGSGAAAVVMTGAGTSLAGAAPRPPQPAVASCSGPATISGFAFRPNKVVGGQTATLHIAITNCSAKNGFNGTLTTYGRMCQLVLDPLPRAVTVARASTLKTTQSYSVPPCGGSGKIYGQLSFKGKTISQKVALVTILAPPQG